MGESGEAKHEFKGLNYFRSPARRELQLFRQKMRLKLKEGARPSPCSCVFCDDPCLGKSMEIHREDGRIVRRGEGFFRLPKDNSTAFPP